MEARKLNVNVTIPVKQVIAIRLADFPTSSNRLLPPNNVGTYVLRDVYNNALYVGMSTNLIERIKSHINGKDSSSEFSDKIRLIEVYITKNNAYADMLETYLIINEKPTYNKAKVPRKENEFILDLETELFDIDENIELWKEQLDELYSEIDDSYQSFLDDATCIHTDIQRIKTKIRDAETRRRYLISKGAKPLENFSQLVHEESRQKSNNFYIRAIKYAK